MNMRIMGAILLIIGSAGTGFAMTSAFRREVVVLRQMENLICDIYCDLEYRLTPLPQLLCEEASRFNGVLRVFLLCVVKELEAQISPNIACCFEAALSKHPELPASVQRILQELGESLGRFNLQGQLRCLDNVKNSCKRILLSLENKQTGYTRSCQAYCLCVGVAVALLLL